MNRRDFGKLTLNAILALPLVRFPDTMLLPTGVDFTHPFTDKSRFLIVAAFGPTELVASVQNNRLSEIEKTIKKRDGGKPDLLISVFHESYNADLPSKEAIISVDGAWAAYAITYYLKGKGTIVLEETSSKSLV